MQIKMDNQINYSPLCHQDDSKRKELVLDTGGFCFLCLKETCSNKTENDGTEMVEACLRSICRYLNINPCSILLKSLKGDELSREEKQETLLQQNKYDFSVMLCSKCSKLSNKLSELIGQLDMTNMLLKHHIEEYYERLIESTESKQVRSKWNIFQEKLGVTGSNTIEVCLVEQLRREATVKSVAKLGDLQKGSVPKVLVMKIKNSQEFIHQSKDVTAADVSHLDAFQSEASKRRKTSDNSSFIDENSPQAIIKMSKSSDSVDDTPIQTPTETNQISTCGFQSSPSSKNDNFQLNGDHMTEESDVIHLVNDVIPEKVHSSTKNAYILYILEKNYKKEEAIGKEVHRCLICKNVIKPYHTNITIKHLIDAHPEVFFAHKKANHISHRSFKRHCENLLGEKCYFEFTVEIETNSLQQPINLSRNCGFCETRNITIEHWKYHFILQHFEYLEEKLLQFQSQAKIDQDCATFVRNVPNFETCSASSRSSVSLQESSFILENNGNGVEITNDQRINETNVQSLYDTSEQNSYSNTFINWSNIERESNNQNYTLPSLYTEDQAPLPHQFSHENCTSAQFAPILPHNALPFSAENMRGDNNNFIDVGINPVKNATESYNFISDTPTQLVENNSAETLRRYIQPGNKITKRRKLETERTGKTVTISHAEANVSHQTIEQFNSSSSINNSAPKFPETSQCKTTIMTMNTNNIGKNCSPSPEPKQITNPVPKIAINVDPKSNSVPLLRSKKGIWICNENIGGCGKQFSYFYGLKRHRTYSCLNKKQVSKLPNETVTSIKKHIQKTTKCEQVFFKYVLGKHCEVVKTMKQKLYRCLVCKVCPKPCGKVLIMKHLVNLHPDVFFLHKLTANLPQNYFHIQCKTLLSKMCKYKEFNSINSVHTKQNRYKSEKEYFCELCNNKIFRDGFDLRFHLMMEHYDNLEMDIANIQLNENHDELIFQSTCFTNTDETVNLPPNDIQIDLETEFTTTSTPSKEIVSEIENNCVPTGFITIPKFNSIATFETSSELAEMGVMDSFESFTITQTNNISSPGTSFSLNDQEIQNRWNQNSAKFPREHNDNLHLSSFSPTPRVTAQSFIQNERPTTANYAMKSNTNGMNGSKMDNPQVSFNQNVSSFGNQTVDNNEWNLNSIVVKQEEIINNGMTVVSSNFINELHNENSNL